LAQAQQAVAASALERTFGFVGNLAAVFPEVADVVDADKGARDYAEILGNTPDLIKDRKTVALIRKQRADAQAQAAVVQQAGNAAQGAKVLSETDTQNPNALTDLLGRGGSI
jgi:hypothetical protein